MSYVIQPLQMIEQKEFLQRNLKYFELRFLLNYQTKCAENIKHIVYFKLLIFEHLSYQITNYKLLSFHGLINYYVYWFCPFLIVGFHYTSMFYVCNCQCCA